MSPFFCLMENYAISCQIKNSGNLCATKKGAVTRAFFKREKYEKIYDDQNKFFVLMSIVYNEFVSRVSKLSHEILTIFIRNLTITKGFHKKTCKNVRTNKKLQGKQKGSRKVDAHAA